MKKIKNKFILLIIFIILIIIILQLFIYYFLNKQDRGSYVVLIEGRGTINKILLEKDERKFIYDNSVIKSIGDNSIVIIEWGDGSITRLGGNTDIIINEIDIKENLSQINIDFNLLSGKTWSNVITFLGKDSYFRENFHNLEAGVRGTIFNVDLNKNYINVINHEVTLTNKLTSEIYLVTEHKPFSLNSLSFIELKHFILNIKDKSWEKFNFEFDKEYFNKLKISFSKGLEDNNPLLFILEIFSPKYSLIHKVNNNENFNEILKIIKKLSEKDRNFAYKNILTRYQSIHFSSGNNLELFKRKLYYKRVLILLANKENKEILVKNTIFDLKEVFKLKDNILLKDIITIFEENKKVIEKIDIKLNLKYFPDGNDIKIINRIIHKSINDLGISIEQDIYNKLNNLFGIDVK